MTVSSGNASELYKSGQRRAEPAVARRTMLEREAEPVGAAPSQLEQLPIVSLGEVDDAAVVAEDVRRQLGMPGEPERPDDHGVEGPDEEVREVEGPGLLLLERIPLRQACEKGIAVGAGQPLGAVLLEHLVERTRGPAVGIGDEDVV